MKKPLGKGWHPKHRKPINKADGGWVDLEPEKEAKPSMLEAAYRGLQKGATANWNDEIEGVQEASGINKLTRTLNPMIQIPAMAVGAGRMLLGDGMKDYESSRDYIRERQKAAEKEHPVTSTVSELGGALLMPTGPVGGVAKSALTGAGYGLASGVGEGEGLKDSIVKGGVGTLFGAGAGAIAPKAAEYIGDAAGWVGDKFRKAVAPMRRMTDPENQALPYFMEKMKRDIDSGKALTQEQLDFARQYGLPIMGGDLGGKEVQSMARWAADTSPSALGKMNEALDARALGEGSRLAAGIENLTLAPNSRQAVKQLKDDFGIVNDSAYAAAKAKGQEGIQSPVLEDLLESDAMKTAMKKAAVTFKNLKAAGSAEKAYHAAEDGSLRPTLEYMDLVKRSLDDMISAAKKDGNNTEAMAVTKIKNKLVNELDNWIPEYATARGIFSEFKGATNSAEAGQKIFEMSNNPKLYDQPFMKMLESTTSAERGMLASGYLTAMADKIRSTPDSQNIARQLLNSPQSREVAERILGTRKVGEIQMMVQLEKAAGQLRGAVQGNSITSRLEQAKRLVNTELGWAGAATAAGAISSGSVFDPYNALWGAGAFVTKRGRDKYVAKSQQKWADQIAEYIVTQDMSKLRQAAKQMAASPWAKRDVTKTVERLTKIGGSQAPAASGPLRITVGPRQTPADEDQE